MTYDRNYTPLKRPMASVARGGSIVEIDAPHEKAYKELVEYWKNAADDGGKKKGAIKILTNFCKFNTADEVYLLKRAMEVHFAREVGCWRLESTLWMKARSYFANWTDDSMFDGYGCDLRELIYTNENTVVRGGVELLKKLQTKANELVKRHGLSESPLWHIITDVDDTLYAAGYGQSLKQAVNVAGSDISWDHGVPYPGIVQFYKQFYARSPPESRYTTLLSAIPYLAKFHRIHDERISGILNDDIPYGFIHGSDKMTDIAEGMRMRNLYQKFGDVKFEKFMQYQTIFPEYRLIFIGDDGQGDLQAGIKMRQHSPWTEVFIHRITQTPDGYFREKPSTTPGIRFFDNYFDLSVQFKELRIFNDADVDAVKRSMCDTVTQTDGSSYKQNRKRNLYADCE